MTGEKFKQLFSYYPFIIAAFVFLLCIAVWPLRLIGHTSYESSSLERGIFPNLNLSDGSVVIGEFTPFHDRLDSISFQFLISGSAPDGTVTLELYNQFDQQLYSVTMESGDIMNYRWIKFPVNMELSSSETYTWRLRAYDYDEASLSLYSGSPLIGPEEAGAFYYNGYAEEKLTPAVTYTYTDKVDQQRCLPYYTVFVLLGLLLLAPQCNTAHCQSESEKTNEEL
ncbi:MAG: hypothetical protein J6C33_12050 [Lachnospiraceae bacterium]|nr:hypothetical protein [Lachnospiraceae bacterium]